MTTYTITGTLKVTVDGMQPVEQAVSLSGALLPVAAQPPAQSPAQPPVDPPAQPPAEPPAPVPSPPPAPAAGWTKIASENETKTVPAGSRVRFGADVRWVEKEISGSFVCNRDTFGSDPAYMTAKTCELYTAVAAPPPNPNPPAPSPTAGVVVSFVGTSPASNGALTLSASLADATLHKTTASGHKVYRKALNADLTAWFEVTATDVLAWLHNGFTHRVTPVYSGLMTLTIDGVQRAAHSVVIAYRARPAFWPQRISLVQPPSISAIETALAQRSAAKTVQGAAEVNRITKSLSDSGVVLTDSATGTTWALASSETPLVAADVEYPLVPKATMAVAESAIARLPVVYDPMMVADYPAGMGNPGYHSSIGLLMEHQVIYLATKDPRALRSVVLHGLVAGARFPIHMLDEGTFEIPSFDANPGMSTDYSEATEAIPAAAGWATSHHPSIYYLAYMLTGWEYFAEGLRMTAAYIHFSQTVGYRQKEKGILLTNAGTLLTRGAAWGLRTLMQAVIVSPAGSQYEKALQNNVDFYHAQYVAQSNNPQGCCSPYSSYTADVYSNPSWMEDFLTIAWAYIYANRPDAKTKAIFDWKAQYSVGRFGDPADPASFDYRDVGQYYLPIAPTAVPKPDWKTGTGPWYSTFRQIHQAKFEDSAARLATPGKVLRGDGSGVPAGGQGYWANAVAALATVRQAGAAGAEAAWQRLTSAVNWKDIADGFKTDPVWGINVTAAVSAPAPSPSPSDWPAWRKAMAPNSMVEFPNTAAFSGKKPVNWAEMNASGGLAGRINSWSGFGAVGTQVVMPGGGGHVDWAGNECYVIDLSRDVPIWDMPNLATPYTQVRPDVAYYADGRPTSSHIYYAAHGVGNEIVRVHCGVPFGSGNSGNAACTVFSIDTMDWVPQGKYPDAPSAIPMRAMCKDFSTEQIYMAAGFGLHVRDPATGVWKALANLPQNSDDVYYTASAVDHSRGRVVFFRNRDTAGQGLVYDKASNTMSAVTFSGDDVSKVIGGFGLSAWYVPGLDRFVMRTAEAAPDYYLIHPTTFVITKVTPTGGAGIMAAVTGIFNKFIYVPSLKGCFYQPQHASNAWFLALE